MTSLQRLDEFVMNNEFCNCQLVFNVHLDIPAEYSDSLYSDYQESETIPMGLLVVCFHYPFTSSFPSI